MSPDGYQPHTRRSPLTDPWKPVLARETARRFARHIATLAASHTEA